MTQASSFQPPRIAVWLIDLFTPYQQEESIPGDLLEEFTDIASKSGVASARRWYWRQSVRTILHLVVTGLRAAPLSVFGPVVGGLLLFRLGSSLPERAIVAVLDFHRQPHVTPYYTWPQVQTRVWWLSYGVLMGLLLMSLFIGCIVAAVAKGQEMVATTTLGLLFGILGAVEFLVWSVGHGYSFLPLPLVISLGVPIMIVIGGGIVRKSRSGYRIICPQFPMSR
jgi:hypothetical protein